MHKIEIKLAVILGTGRKGRLSERVSTFLFNEIKKDIRFDVVFVDVRDFVFGVTDDSGTSESALKWKEIVLSSKALLFVSPEYNRSYPGELKMLLDSLFSEYSGKLAGICGVSSGGFGGVRLAEKLKSLFLVFGMKPLQNDIYVSFVGKDFDEQSVPKSLSVYTDKLKLLLDEIDKSV